MITIKHIQKTLAVSIALFHAVTFCGPVHAAAIDIQEGTKLTISDLEDGSTIRVIGADGSVNEAGRAILEVLNRVNISQGLDVIGIVALLAQMGIHIESTAQINVTGGLILSSLGIDEAAFLAGMNEIAAARGAADPAMILNEGNIHLDANSFLVMLASAVKNVGNIAANGGTVIMAAGDKAMLTLGGDGLVNVEVTKPIEAEVLDFQGNKVSDVISNKGKISAEGGFVKLTAKGSEALFDSIINHTGIIEAQSVSEKNGKIVLGGGDEGIVRVDGVLDVSGRDEGEKGGIIYVFGDKIGLYDGVRIDASGDIGGGEVLIGGDFQGSGTLPHANYLYMDPLAEIHADAITNGNGGKVILWSDEATRAYGTITARGGAEGGDGGLIETSGHYLDVAGIRVDAGSAKGKVGQWLLDPYNVTIVAGSGYNKGTWDGSEFIPFNNNATIGATEIENALNTGTDVTITTGTALDGGGQAGDITVSAAISKTAGTIATLSLLATGSIIVNAAITSTVDALNVILNAASGGVTLAAGISTNGGNFQSNGDNFTSNASGMILTGGGSVTFSHQGDISIGAAIDSQGAGTDGIISILGNQLNLTGTLNSGSADITIAPISAKDMSIGDNIGGAFNISDAELANISTTGTLQFGGSTAQSITVNSITYTGDLLFDSSAVGGAVTFTGGASSITGDLTLTADDMTISSAIDVGAGNVTLETATAGTTIGLGGGAGSFQLTDAEADNITASTLTVGASTSGDVQVDDFSPANTSTLVIRTGGSVTETGDAAADITVSNLAIDSATGVNIDTAVTNLAFQNSTSGDVDIANTGALTINSVGGLATSFNNGGGTTTVTAASPVTVAVDIIQAGTIDLTAGESVGAGDDLTVNGGVTVQSTAGNVNLKAGDDIDLLATSTVTSDTGTILLQAGASDFDGLGDINLAGDVNSATTLSLYAFQGAITQTAGALLVFYLVANAGGSATLAQSGNNATNFSASTGGDLTYADADALDILSASVGGNLNLTTQGAITQAGAVSVSGTSSFTADNAGTKQDITLDDVTNDFTGAISADGNNVTIKDANSLDVDTINAAGDATLVANTGAITDANGSGTNNVAAGGALNATAATGIDLDTTVNSLTAHVTGTGDLSIRETNDITLTDVDTANGAIGITSGGNMWATDVQSLTDDDANDINLQAKYWIYVDLIDAGTSNGDVDLTVTNGGISNVNGSGTDVVADTLTVSVTSGVNLDTQVNTLNASTVGGALGNNIWIDEVDDINLASVTTTNGTITITAGGTITATDVDSSATDNGNNNIKLTANSGDILVGKVNAGTSANDVTLNAVAGAIRGITDDGVADVTGDVVDLTAGAGGISGAAGVGALDVAATGQLNADTTTDNGNITIDSIGNLPVGLVNAGAGAVALVSTGNITDALDTSAANVLGGNISLTAIAGGIGAIANYLDFTATTSFSADTTTDNGNMYVRSVGDAPIDLIDAGSGDVSLTSTGNITDATDTSAANVLGANISLTAMAGGMGVIANYLDFTATTSFNADTTTDNGNMYVRSVGDAPIDVVNAGSGDVNLISTGDITDVTDTSAANVLGGNISLTAMAGGIGAIANYLDFTATTSFSADTTTDNSNIYVGSVGNAPIDVVNAGSGDVSLTSTGNITDATDTSAANVLGANISLTAMAGGMGVIANYLDFTATTSFNADTTTDNGNMYVRSVGDAPIDLIDAGTGDVYFRSSGNMTDFRNDDNANVRGGIVDLTAEGADDIGALTNYFDIEPSTSWNVTMNGGTPYIHCIGACPVDKIDVGTAIFFYKGNLIDGNDNVNGIYDKATDTWSDVSGNPADWNIYAGGVHIEADNGIGTSTNWIEMHLQDPSGVAGDGLLMADGGVPGAFGTGGVFVSNGNKTGNGLTLGGIVGTLTNAVTAQGGIVIMSGSPLTIIADVIDTLGNDIWLVSLGNTAADDLSVNTNINITTSGGANTGNITMMAGDTIALNSGVSITASGTGDVNLYAGENYANGVIDQDGNTGAAGGSVMMTDTSVADAGSGRVVADAASDVLLSSVQTTSNATDAVTITARAGAISDSGDTDTDIVTGTSGQATLNAVTGIGSGDAIETSVGVLDATNTTSGNLEVDQVALGGALGILRADQQGAGDLIIRTLDGILTVVAGPTGFGVSATSGETTLSAQGAGSDDDLAVNNTVTSTTGKINLDSTSRDVTFSADGDVTATGGAEIEVNAQRNVTMSDGTILNANGGGPAGVIDIDAVNGDVTLGSVQTTSNASTRNGDAFDAADIQATSGQVIDGGDTDIDIVTGASGQATLNASTGIGSGDAIETSIGGLDATNTTSGAVEIDEVAAGGALDILRADQQGAGDLIIRTLDGILTVAAGPAGLGVSATSGETTLSAQGAGSDDDLAVNNTVTSTTGKINLDSTSRDVTFSADGDVTATGGAEIEVNAQRNVTMSDGTILNANGGGPAGVIDIDAVNGDVTLGSVQTTSTASTLRNGDAFDAVDIRATNGQIIDGGDTDANIVANSGQTTLRTLNGVGDSDAIETEVYDLDAINGTVPGTGTGNLNITELAVGGPINAMRLFQYASTGNTFVQTQNGNLTVTQSADGGLGVRAVDGTTTLYGGGVGDLEVENTVNSADGQIQLESDNNVYFTAAGDVTAGDVTLKVGATGAEVEVEARTGQVRMADGTLIDAGNGQVDIDAQQNITIGGIRTSNTTSNAVEIVSRAGQIIDGGDTYTDIQTGTGGGMLLSADTGIGSADGLDTRGSELAAYTDSGNIQVHNTGALEIRTIIDDNDPTTFFGSPGAGTVVGATIADTIAADPAGFIWITATGPMLISSVVTNRAGGNVSLYALGGTAGVNTMTINANVRSEGGNGDIRLASGSNMTQAAGVTISTAGNGVVSGTGQIYIGAGYNATGKAANEPVTPGTSLTNLSVSLFDTIGDAGANFTMTSTSSVTTEDGNILADAQNNFTVGLLHADGGTSDLSDSVRGDVTTFSRNGSTLDADPVGGTITTDIYADTWDGFSGGTIGLSSNPIEANAFFQNLTALGGIYVQNAVSVVVDIYSSGGDIDFRTVGNILLGRAFAPGGAYQSECGGFNSFSRW